jgi:chromosome segregation ATPase
MEANGEGNSVLLEKNSQASEFNTLNKSDGQVISNGDPKVLDDGTDEVNSTRKKSTSKKLGDIEQFLLNLQDELNKLEDDESALFTHANQRQAVSSLRLNLNKRLGELWSIEVVESKKLRGIVDELTQKLENTREDYEKQIDDLERELHNESQARLNLENELIQYRKEVMDLGAEIWTTNQSNDGKDIECLSDSSREASRGSGFRSRSASDVQDNETFRQDEVDGGRKRSICRNPLRRVSSAHESDSDDSLYEKRKDLFQAEVDTKNTKAELHNLKQTFVQLNQELADSGKVRQELEERFVNLVNDRNVISLKFKATEEKNRELEEKLNHVSILKTSLQDELLKVKSVARIHLEDIRTYKEKNANFEVERTRLKQELSVGEIKFTTMDNKYREIDRELFDTKKLLQDTQGRLRAYEDELRHLRDAYERLRSQVEDDSDRESLVEVKMKGGQRRDSATPSRIQSIHLVTRAKSQVKKKPSYLASKKKMSIKRSPRQDDTSPRRSTLKRGTLGRRGTPTSPRDSKTLTRDSDRNTLKQTKTSERRTTIKRDSDEDHKLKSELLLAKEQLVRLKGELTLSNIQTANLGTHLTSLREDSNKLEVELSSMSWTPNSKETNKNSGTPTTTGSRDMDIELAGAKEKIIELQDRILSLRREKATGLEKLSESEDQMKKLRSDIYKSRDSLERSQEVVTILKKEIEVLAMKNQILQERLTNYSRETVQRVVVGDSEEEDNDQRSQKFDNEQWSYHEQDRLRLQKEIEELSNDKVKLEDMKNLVQKLVDVEDEQLLLKRRLRNAVKQVEDDGGEKITSEATKIKDSSEKRNSLKTNEGSHNTSEDKNEEYYVENTALRCEVDALRIYIANLENEIKSVKYKLSVSESMQGNKDKKALAILLASAKHEREELRETLNGVYSEKEDLEEALNVARVKSERLQRELSHVAKKRTELEVEMISMKSGTTAPEKDTPTSSMPAEEKRLVELIKGFLYNIGVQNAEEKDIRDLAKSFLSRKNQLTEVSGD